MMAADFPHNIHHNTTELLQPELLSNDRLISILEHRHVKLQNLNSYSRDMLLQLFHTFAVPLPQRKKKHESCINEVVNSKTRKTDIEIVNHDYKRMKLNNEFTADGQRKTDSQNFKYTLKRAPADEIVCIGEPPNKKHRKKITWP